MVGMLPRLRDQDRWVLGLPDDTEDAPWMVMADLQERDARLLREILDLHVERHRLPWYLASYLLITMRLADGARLPEAAPDLLMVAAPAVAAPPTLRRTWDVNAEGKPPQFVLEVVSRWSQRRDTEEKPAIYRAYGVREYAIFAPERTDGGPVLSGHRLDEAGEYRLWRPDGEGILWSQELGGLGLYVEDKLWLRVVDANRQRLPTPRELAEAEARTRRAAIARQRAAETARAEEAARRQAAEAAQAEEALKRQAAEAAQAEDAAKRQAAEAEVARLQEELRRLREGLR